MRTALRLAFHFGVQPFRRADEYAGLEYRGDRHVSLTAFADTDTLLIAAGPTSLDGRWMLSDGRLLFLDYYMVGVREYDMQGRFISRHISRGPGTR